MRSRRGIARVHPTGGLGRDEAVKVAFTTQDRVHINAPLGWASQIVVYEVSAHGYHWLETFEFPNYSRAQNHHDSLAAKVAAIADCTLVYVADLRDRAIAHLMEHPITPLQALSELETMTEVLDRLCMVLQGTPPPWLHQSLHRGCHPPTSNGRL